MQLNCSPEYIPDGFLFAHVRIYTEPHLLPLGTKTNLFEFWTCWENHYKSNAKLL